MHQNAQRPQILGQMSEFFDGFFPSVFDLLMLFPCTERQALKRPTSLTCSSEVRQRGDECREEEVQAGCEARVRAALTLRVDLLDGVEEDVRA